MPNDIYTHAFESIGALAAIIWSVARIWIAVSNKLSKIASKEDVAALDKKVDRIERELKEDINEQIKFSDEKQAIKNIAIHERLNEISEIVPKEKK